MVNHFFLLDVKNDEPLIEQRQEYHKYVCPEIERVFALQQFKRPSLNFTSPANV